MSDSIFDNMTPEEMFHITKKSRDTGVPVATLHKLNNLQYRKPRYTRLSEKKLFLKVKEACQINNLPEVLEMQVFKCIIEYLKTGVSKPILLTGSAGIGKTYFATVLANIMGLGFYKVSAPGAATNYGLTGDCPNYKAGRYGEISAAQLSCGSTNPVILIDEIDKAQYSQTSGHNITDELLSCLDDTRTIKDNFLNRDVDTKGIVFILTANDDTKISPWLKDRCNVIHFPNPDFDRVLAISVQMVEKLNDSPLYRRRIDIDYDDMIDALKTIYNSDHIVSLRKYNTIISEAVTVAFTEYLNEETDSIQLNFRHFDKAYSNLFDNGGVGHEKES